MVGDRLVIDTHNACYLFIAKIMVKGQHNCFALTVGQLKDGILYLSVLLGTDFLLHDEDLN